MQPPKGYRAGRGALRRLGPTDGALSAMRAVDGAGAHVPDLSLAVEVGTTYRITWVPVPDRDARTTPTRRQLGSGDVTRSRKLEGAWWANDGAYVVCSFSRENDNPGVAKVHDGQRVRRERQQGHGDWPPATRMRRGRTSRRWYRDGRGRSPGRTGASRIR